MSHQLTLERSVSTTKRARTIERALSPEVAAIDGDRSRTQIERDGTTLTVRIDAADPTALRAGKHTWFSLLRTAAETTALTE